MTNNTHFLQSFSFITKVAYIEKLLLFFFAIFFVNFAHTGESIKQNDIKSTKNEGAEFIQLDNGFCVWTKRIGEGPIKILTLHGGPGCTHEYFECFEDFFPKDQFQIIFYDQLGSHYSDKPEDSALWTVERFCEEVEQVR